MLTNINVATIVKCYVFFYKKMLKEYFNILYETLNEKI